MVISRNSLKIILTLLILLNVVLPVGFSTAFEGHLSLFSLKPEIAQTDQGVISPEVIDALPYLKKDELIEVLILLKEQTDTARVAYSARQSLSASASSSDQKDQCCVAVVSALKETAERTQLSLLNFLEDEKLYHRGVAEFRSYYVVNIIYARVSADVIHKLSMRPEVKRILPNQRIMLVEPKISEEAAPLGGDNIEWNIKHINVPSVWAEYDHDGTGVVIGVIDTGTSWDHEALKEKWRGYNPADPENPDPIYNWLDVINGEPLPYDDHKHGTHVTGTILGSDSAGNNLIGVAPGASWIAVKALNKNGYGTSAQFLAAGEYMLAPYDPSDPEGTADPSMAPDIINNSWGGSVGLSEWYRLMVQAWRDAGIIPVFAAGNKGPAAETIIAPANYPESFAVAAVNINNDLANFSSRGPGPYPDSLKPEICAPGVNIRSSVPGGGYESGWYGTSMAAPHVSGVAALLLSANADLTIDDLEELIIDSATILISDEYSTTPNYGFGHGLVDAYHAFTFLVNGYGSISGQVLAEGDDENGLPLAALITVLESGRMVRTDPDSGIFFLNHQAGQDWTLKVESDGYYTEQHLFSLSDEENLELGSLILKKIAAMTIDSIIADLESPQETGTAITWTVTASGGKVPYQYAYYVYHNGERVRTKWYSESDSITFIPMEAGTYRVRVFVRDASGSLIWDDSADLLCEGETLFSISISSVIQDLESPQETGTAVTWTVTKSGGKVPYQYAYYVYCNNVRIYTLWYSGNDSLVYAAYEPGDYFVRAFVRDSSGNIIWHDSPLFVFEGDTLFPLVIDAVLPDLLSPQDTDTAVTWTVTASGGEVPYQYAYYVYCNNVRIYTKWYSRTNKITYSTTEPGDYRIRAFVRDYDDSLVWQDSDSFQFFTAD